MTRMLLCRVAGIAFLATFAPLSAADIATPINTVCPIMPEEVVDSGSYLVEYNGKTYGLCCGSCVDEWEADPAAWAAVVAEQMAATGAPEPQTPAKPEGEADSASEPETASE